MLTNKGVARGIIITGSSTVKTVKHLPHYYTEVPPAASSVKGSTIPSTSLTSLRQSCFTEDRENEHGWLKNTMDILAQAEDKGGVTSWAAYPAKNHTPGQASSSL